MNSNPHHSAALNRLGVVHDSFMQGGDNNVPNTLAMIQAEATLALAYEQRTANLIAVYNSSEEIAYGLTTANKLKGSDWETIAKQIASRLGLVQS